MKKLLTAMFVALLMVGCGSPDDEENSFGWSDANKPASTGVIDLDDKIREAKENKATVLDLQNTSTK